MIVVILTIGYTLIAKVMGLPDYWWKTAFCFPIGTIIAAKSEKLQEMYRAVANKGRIIIILLVVTMLSMGWIIIDRWSTLLLQLISFAGFAVGFSFLFDRLEYEDQLFRKVGNWSLCLYLIYIGLVGIIITNGNPEGLLLFILVTTVLTALSELLAVVITRKK